MKNEIAFNNRDDALKVADILVSNGYVVMLSVEERLTILNYLDGSYSSYLETVIADRNSVVFMTREEYDTENFTYEKEEEDDE